MNDIGQANVTGLHLKPRPDTPAGAMRLRQPLTVVGGFAVLVDIKAFFLDARIDADTHQFIDEEIILIRYPGIE